jgi:hypothetical protein
MGAIIGRRLLPGLSLAPSGDHGVPVLGVAQEVLGEVLDEPARVGEPGTRRGIQLDESNLEAG